MYTLLAQIKNPVLNPLIGSGEGNIALAIILANLFRTVIIVGGLALLLFLAWGGVSWITAGGDKTKVDAARDRITNAVMGMAVLAGTLAIALLLNRIFGFDLLNPPIPTNAPSAPSSATDDGIFTMPGGPVQVR